MENEKRLIDAYEFYKKFVNTHTIPVGEQRYVATWRISDLIADAPTVDAEPVVHGRWVMKETMIRSPFAKNAYCSECREETSYAHNYCPNCGAKMDGERNDGE